MIKKIREPIAPVTAADVLFLSDRTCCVCRIRRPVQIHHMDEDPSNNDPANLAVLCFDCHRDTQIKGGFDRKLDLEQIAVYREDWFRRVSENRSRLNSPREMAEVQEELIPFRVETSGEYLLHAEDPIIVWRMPRGALVLSSIQGNNQETIADYCSYNGSWRGSTHYHPAYQTLWWDGLNGIKTQYRKLQIERGDWDYAQKPLKLMSLIAERQIVVQPDGNLDGEPQDQFDYPDLMKVYVAEDVPIPRVPETYFRLGISGALRDLAEQLRDLRRGFSMRDVSPEKVADAKTELKYLRRASRIEAQKALPKDDPAMQNLLEVVQSFEVDASMDDYLSWSEELTAVLVGAIKQVHEISQ